ncbi:Mu transposase C-terminal domain-containing protein [Actinobacillus delphinicola]|uniref:Phage transposase n=1 Tax=Actinobacillus delphinicola TaxID=51161 RepID=A0A448TUW4_9PAST|nr:Mu transposase C-terminal domain-containing protein [Actinobacillus delphinicola]VEJ09720.1 phage transposase [Actinobacillus delphinicola]
MNNSKLYYTARELLSLNLKDLPITVKGIIQKANRENWVSRPRQARGGGYEYAITSLPKTVQTALRHKLASDLTEKQPQVPVAFDEQAVRNLNQKQLSISDARNVLGQYLLLLEGGRKCVRNKVVDTFLDKLKVGDLPPHIMEAIRKANARSKGEAKISKRTLMDCLLNYEKSQSTGERVLRQAPKRQGRPQTDVTQLAWLHDFLTFYRVAQGVKVTHAYRRFERAVSYKAPSLSAVQRVVAKLPEIFLEKGRLTGAQYRALLPCVRRDWSQLSLFDCFIGDGHGFKAKVKHPEHAHGFQPEITALIDGRSRLIVGWSVAQSESSLAVADALRHAIQNWGTPYIYYSDNGGGETNKTLDDDVTGMLPRLGISHETGIAGNPQGRGIIERLWQSTLIPLARSYETYTGSTMDGSTKHLIYRRIESAVNAIEKGKELSTEQRRFYKKMPHFLDFVADVERCFADYNNRPHSSLPKKDNGEHFSPLEYANWIMKAERITPRKLHPLEEELLFRPETVRQVRRGEIELFTNRYFSTQLATYHNEKVRVLYDIHDPSYVFVKTMDGEWICKAELDGNKVAAFPQSVVERAKAKSVAAQNKRLQTRIERNNRELNPAITLQADDELLESLARSELLEIDQEEQPIFLTQAEKDHWEQQHRKAVGE